MTTQFSKKHYVAIAKVLAAQIEALEQEDVVGASRSQQKAVRHVGVALAHLFKDDSPNFNEDQFLKAAGVR